MGEQKLLKESLRKHNLLDLLAHRWQLATVTAWA